MSYKITDYSKEQAKKLGVLIKPSRRKNKKIDVFSKNNEKLLASIGQIGYLDFPSYKKEQGIEVANMKRRAYKSRHEKDRHKKGTPGFYADKILW